MRNYMNPVKIKIDSYILLNSFKIDSSRIHYFLFRYLFSANGFVKKHLLSVGIISYICDSIF